VGKNFVPTDQFVLEKFVFEEVRRDLEFWADQTTTDLETTVEFVQQRFLGSKMAPTDHSKPGVLMAIRQSLS
jgi:hypothetical protein